MLEVQDAYGKLLRLRSMLERTPPLDRRTRAAYSLRIEEIRAYLDRLTSGIYTLR